MTPDKGGRDRDEPRTIADSVRGVSVVGPGVVRVFAPEARTLSRRLRDGVFLSKIFCRAVFALQNAWVADVDIGNHARRGPLIRGQPSCPERFQRDTTHWAT